LSKKGIDQIKSYYRRSQSRKRYVYRVAAGRQVFRLQLAILLESIDQIIGDHLRGAAFNLMAFYNMHQFAIFK
jgi:hypothetical protein